MKKMNLSLFCISLLLLQPKSVFAADPGANQAAEQISQSFFSAYKHYFGYGFGVPFAIIIGACVNEVWYNHKIGVIEANAEADVKRKNAETESKILEENNRYAAHEKAEQDRLRREEIIREASKFVQQFNTNNDDATFCQQIIGSNEGLSRVTTFYHISKAHIKALASIKNGEYEATCTQLQERLEANQKRARSIPALRIEQDREHEQEMGRKGKELDNLVKERTAETLAQYTQASKKTAQFVEESTNKIQALTHKAHESIDQTNKQLLLMGGEIKNWYKTSSAQLDRYLPQIIALSAYIQNLASKDDVVQITDWMMQINALVARIEKSAATKDDVNLLHKRLDACLNNEQLRAAMEQITKPLASLQNQLNGMPNKNDFNTFVHTVTAKTGTSTHSGWNAQKATTSAPAAGPEHEEE